MAQKWSNFNFVHLTVGNGKLLLFSNLVAMSLEEERVKLLCSKLLWIAGPPPLRKPLTPFWMELSQNPPPSPQVVTVTRKPLQRSKSVAKCGKIV